MPQERKHSQTYLIIAGTAGFLIAILVTIRIWIPTLSLLGQLSQFSPLGRFSILVKMLSPILSFLLTGGWVWVLLLLGDHWLSWQGNKEDTSNLRSYQNMIFQDHQYRLEQPGTVQESARQEWETRKQIGVPPLFQLDPTDPWQYKNLPVTPLAMTNPDRSPLVGSTKAEQGEEGEIEREEVDEGDAASTQAEQIMQSNVVAVPLQAEQIEEKESDGGEESKKETIETQAEQIMQSNIGNVPSQQEGQRTATASEESQKHFSLQKSETPKPVTLTLLKQINCWVHADDGTSIEVKLRGGENAIRLIQLAYIAWRQGAAVDRDKMLTYVIARGKRRDMNTDQLGEVFDAAKRYLRQDLDRAVKELEKNGHHVTGDIDFFSNEPGFYSLHSSCRVVDLEEIEEFYNPIQIARHEGVLDEKLNGTLPHWVIEACQKLVKAYSGNFLQELLEKFPDEFGPWVKEPVTLYRDKYLDVLLIMANYESAQGRTFLDNALSIEQNEEQRRYHIGKAAQLFYDYAMYALNMRWDQKLKFAYRAGKDGERVVRAARAIRRCVVELGKLGNPDMIDQVWLSFKERMSTLSEGSWKPDRDTESDVTEAKRTTSEYRFSSQIPAH